MFKWQLKSFFFSIYHGCFLPKLLIDHWFMLRTVTVHVFIEETDFELQGVNVLIYKYLNNLFRNSTHLIDNVDNIRYIPCLLLVQIPAMDMDVSQEWKEYESLCMWTEFWPSVWGSINCKHESSGGSLRSFRTPTRKSSPFTLRYWPSMKWTPNHADFMPVYVLDKTSWNYKIMITL